MRPAMMETFCCILSFFFFMIYLHRQHSLLKYVVVSFEGSLEGRLDGHVSESRRLSWGAMESFVMSCDRKNVDENVVPPPPLPFFILFLSTRVDRVFFALHGFSAVDRRSTGNLQPGEVITVNGTEVMGTQQMVSPPPPLLFFFVAHGGFGSYRD